MSDLGSLTDQLLIASPGLGDPNFSRTVALVCQHDDEGAMGLIVNRLSDYNLGDVLRQMNIEASDESLLQQRVLVGGPVQPERGFVLHDDPREWESSLRVSDRLQVTSSRDILESMAAGNGPQRALVILGYAGWSSGQLEQEMSENAWLSVPDSLDLLFETPLDQRWLAAARQIGVDLRLMTDYAGHA